MSEAPSILVSIATLEEGSPVLFAFERKGQPLSGFVLEHEGNLFAYVNRCPHVTLSLDLGDGIVMTESKKFIECQVHGAQFLPESGECFWGPARGHSLEALPVKRQGLHAAIHITDEPPHWPEGTP
jgi:nitrite reductase/ring-hydroxylating ferredoxin subunit